MSARVAVVVPHYDNQPGLDRLLTALTLQDWPEPFTVAVADDGSPTEPRLDAAGRLDIRLVRQPDRGFRAAAARNLGAGAVEGELLLFLDADMVPEPGYLAAMVRGLTEHDLVVGRRRHADLTGWTGPQVADWLTGHGPAPRALPEPQWLSDGYAATDDLAAGDHRSYRYLISAVLGVRRELFDRVGGFDESFVGYGGEDWELAHRCWLAGADWRHLPGAIAWHDGPDLAGRGTDEHRRSTLAAQRDRLATVLPDPWSRDPGVRSEVPSVAVLLDATGLDVDTIRLLLAALRPGGEVHVWLDGVSAADRRLLERTEGFDGVHHGRPGDRELARIPVLIDGVATGRRLLNGGRTA